jgi:hypothetical protein
MTARSEAELQALLDSWRRPGVVLSREQLRSLVDWSGTPAEERGALEASLAATVQQVEAKPLAPNQRRGHVGWLDRVRALFGRRA